MISNRVHTQETWYLKIMQINMDYKYFNTTDRLNWLKTPVCIHEGRIEIISLQNGSENSCAFDMY